MLKASEDCFRREGNEFWVKENNDRPLRQPMDIGVLAPPAAAVPGTSESMLSSDLSRRREGRKAPSHLRRAGRSSLPPGSFEKSLRPFVPAGGRKKQPSAPEKALHLKTTCHLDECPVELKGWA